MCRHTSDSKSRQNSIGFTWRLAAYQETLRRYALAYEGIRISIPVGLVSSTVYIRAMKAKRLSRLAVEGLSDTGYVAGHESNIESEAADDQQKVLSGSGCPFPRSSY